MEKHENILAWLDALRSGDFRQTQNALRETGPERGEYAYCCLGVACEISWLGHWVDEGSFQDGTLALREEGRDPEYDDSVKYTEEEFTSPDVQEWLGLLDNAGQHYDEKGETVSLAQLNDSGKTFAEICDYIETHPHYLFEADVAQALLGALEARKRKGDVDYMAIVREIAKGS